VRQCAFSCVLAFRGFLPKDRVETVVKRAVDLEERVEACETAFVVIVCDMMCDHKEELDREFEERHFGGPLVQSRLVSREKWKAPFQRKQLRSFIDFQKTADGFSTYTKPCTIPSNKFSIKWNRSQIEGTDAKKEKYHSTFSSVSRPQLIVREDIPDGRGPATSGPGASLRPNPGGGHKDVLDANLPEGASHHGRHRQREGHCLQKHQTWGALHMP
jgi:hypothetical protein